MKKELKNKSCVSKEKIERVIEAQILKTRVDGPWIGHVLTALISVKDNLLDENRE